VPTPDFLEELRLQFERYIQLKDRLDTKANNMITMSGTIATLFMGFGIFLLENIDFTENLILVIIASLALMAEVILTGLTIKYSLDSYKLRSYFHPIGYGAFYQNQDTEINRAVIDQFKNATRDEIDDHFIEEYLKGIKSYQEQNDKQTKGINCAQKTFIWAIVMIPIFSFLVMLGKFLR